MKKIKEPNCYSYSFKDHRCTRCDVGYRLNQKNGMSIQNKHKKKVYHSHKEIDNNYNS